MPDQALSNYDIEKTCKTIPHFRGVFMLNTLPNYKKKKECGVVNFDIDKGPGTHWVCYGVEIGHSWYFDSYGMPPPREIIKYLENGFIYSTFNIQQEIPYICGHLCVYVLDKVMKKKIKFENTVLSIL